MKPISIVCLYGALIVFFMPQIPSYVQSGHGNFLIHTNLFYTMTGAGTITEYTSIE